METSVLGVINPTLFSNAFGTNIYQVHAQNLDQFNDYACSDVVRTLK